MDDETAAKLYPTMAQGRDAPRPTAAGEGSSASEALAAKLYRPMPPDRAPERPRDERKPTPDRKGSTNPEPKKPEKPDGGARTFERMMYPKMAEDVRGAAGAALDLEAPEGFDASSPAFGEFRKAAAELGLDQKGAGRVLELHRRAVEEQAKAIQDAWDSQIASWEKAFETDAELGGAHRGESLSTARWVVDEYGMPGLLEALDESGFGSHPELIRLLARVGQELRDLRGDR